MKKQTLLAALAAGSIAGGALVATLDDTAGKALGGAGSAASLAGLAMNGGGTAVLHTTTINIHISSSSQVM